MNEHIDPAQLKYLKIDFFDKRYTAVLADLSGFEILKGYGETVADAINDLHQNLI